MEPLPIRTNSALGGEPVSLEGTFRGKYRGFAVFLICCALLVAAFAISGVWMNRGGDGAFGKHWGSFWDGASSTEPEDSADSALPTSEPEREPLPTPLPEGAIPVVSMDLSCSTYGEDYIHNETVYKPDLSALRREESIPPIVMDPQKGPVVLILHTLLGRF